MSSKHILDYLESFDESEEEEAFHEEEEEQAPAMDLKTFKTVQSQNTPTSKTNPAPQKKQFSQHLPTGRVLETEKSHIKYLEIGANLEDHDPFGILGADLEEEERQEQEKQKQEKQKQEKQKQEKQKQEKQKQEKQKQREKKQGKLNENSNPNSNNEEVNIETIDRDVVDNIFGDSEFELGGVEDENEPDRPFLDSVTLHQMRDVLTDVFRVLPALDVIACSHVCKVFWAASKSSLIWREKYEKVRKQAVLKSQTWQSFAANVQYGYHDFNDTHFVLPNFELDGSDPRWRILGYVIDKYSQYILDVANNPGNYHRTATVWGTITLTFRNYFEKLGDIFASTYPVHAMSLYTIGQVVHKNRDLGGTNFDYIRKLRVKKTKLLIELDLLVLAHKELEYATSLGSAYFSETAYLRGQLALLANDKQNALSYFVESLKSQKEEKKKSLIRKKAYSTLLDLRTEGRDFCSVCLKFFPHQKKFAFNKDVICFGAVKKNTKGYSNEIHVSILYELMRL